jgi:hypothetical protein
MSSRQFQNYYGINLNTNDGRWEAALAMAQPPSANYFSSYIAPALGAKGIEVFGNEAWLTVNILPAVYAGGLEAENQIAMGLTVAINISLGILKKDYLGALSMRNTQAGSQSVSQAGFLSDGTSSSLDLLIGSVAWRLGEDIDNSKGWFKGKAAWYEGWRLNNPTVNVRMPAPIPNFRISAQAALRMSTTLKVGGGILGVYGLYSTYDDFSSGKISGGEAALDAAFGVIGFFGPWGMVASATYFLVAKPLYKYATSDGN